MFVLVNKANCRPYLSLREISVVELNSLPRGIFVHIDCKCSPCLNDPLIWSMSQNYVRENANNCY